MFTQFKDRDVPEYQEAYEKMNTYHACEIAEGFGAGEDPTQEQQRAAWQYLYDQQAYMWLQGFYGRTMRDMINDGFIIQNKKENV